MIHLIILKKQERTKKYIVNGNKDQQYINTKQMKVSDLQVINAPNVSKEIIQENQSYARKLKSQLARENFPNNVWLFSAGFNVNYSTAKYQEAFPKSFMICQKKYLDQLMQEFLSDHKEIFNFIPKTYRLPLTNESLQELDYTKNYIMKTEKEGGVNIKLLTNVSNYIEDPSKYNEGNYSIIQEYINNPLLLNGRKFDVRIYILVTKTRPFKVFLYKDKLVRICSEEYQQLTPENANDSFIHLTNWGVNRNSNISKETLKTEFKQGIQQAACDGDTIKEQFQQYTQSKYCYELIDELNNKIKEIIKYTMYAGLPKYLNKKSFLKKERYSTVIGGDILFDDKLNAYLLELNQIPALGLSLKVDREIKLQMQQESFNLALYELEEETVETDTLPYFNVYEQCAKEKIEKFLDKANKTHKLSENQMQILNTSLYDLYIEDQILTKYERILPEKNSKKVVNQFVKNKIDRLYSEFYNR